MNINISTTPARMVRIHTSAQNGQQLSSVDISLQNVDKMIAILTECRRQITQSRAVYPAQNRPSYTTHREAGPAYPGQPAGGYNYGSRDGGGGGGYGAGGCGNGL